MNITWARNKSKHIMSVQLLFFIGPSKSFSCNKSNYVMRNGRRFVVGTYFKNVHVVEHFVVVFKLCKAYYTV